MAEKVPGPPVIDSSLEGLKRWQIERQIYQNFFNRGSRYPPFSIEPLPYPTDRTGRAMTDEERFLRKQWLKDQVLAADEPRNVPELNKVNNFRKLYKIPLNAMEGALATVMKPVVANYLRVVLPKAVLGYMVVLFGYYQIRYNHNNWEKAYGPSVFGKMRVRSGEEEPTPIPEEPLFGSRRFYEREFQKNL